MIQIRPFIAGAHEDATGCTSRSFVTSTMKAMSTEVFGPVVSLRSFTDLNAAIMEANYTPYGLRVVIFTSDIAEALVAADRLRFGSGEGREGPAHAVAEMTEERLVSIG